MGDIDRLHTVEALMWGGITPPHHGRKTQCPECSHLRQKPRHRCLAIYERSWGVEWKCFNCNFQGSEDLPYIDTTLNGEYPTQARLVWPDEKGHAAPLPRIHAATTQTQRG